MNKQQNNSKNIAIRDAIIRTLSYSEIFYYPLTPFEIHKYLIHAEQTSFYEVLKVIDLNPKIFKTKDGYVALKEIDEMVRERKERMIHSRLKLARAFLMSNILSIIPSIKLIGVSGSLSMMNAGIKDDIDLFFITKKNTLWITRLIVNLMLIAMGQKRRKGDALAPDKICPNMFISEDRIYFKKEEQNIYIAHEIVQLKVLFDRDHVYSRFIARNKWIKNFLPHTQIPGISKRKKSKLNIVPLKIFDRILFSLQKIYMKRSRTIEKIEKNRAAFHPKDREAGILDLYFLKSNFHRIQEFQKNAEIPKFVSN